MTRNGPFLWFREGGSTRGFVHAPPGGFCVSAFVFLRRGGDILLGRYADDPRWIDLVGLDTPRVRALSNGWTVPGSHLKLGESPVDAARRILTDVLALPPLPVFGPRVVSWFEPHPAFPERGPHHDLVFLFDAEAPTDLVPEAPPWYAALEWQDPRRLPADAFARAHEDVVAAWLERDAPAPESASAPDSRVSGAPTEPAGGTSTG